MPINYPNYVVTPVFCKIKKLNKNISSRTELTAKLDNNYDKSILFILMNPSKANEVESDRTINKCASIAFHDLEHLHIGQFSIVNIYPFYESNSKELNTVINNVKAVSKTFYYREIFYNLKVVENKIRNSDFVMLGTGGIPKDIDNVKEYQFILNTFISYIECHQGKVFLGTSQKYHNKYIYKGKYSYHICPKGNPNTIERIKLHNIKNGKFINLPIEKEIILKNKARNGI
ncbi:DUF1643 domain-containing protein [Bacillus litorisediminis]|uniref:DUF1643 domain-containing protein n=1 Tax=Bacillus litorisediminis TaxID=2922713 RepID=UPI001FAFE06A|nr:DUF1643 domain-containing protein [Bacillus litorisediminis]